MPVWPASCLSPFQDQVSPVRQEDAASKRLLMAESVLSPGEEQALHGLSLTFTVSP